MPRLPAPTRFLAIAFTFLLAACGDDEPTAPRIEDAKFAASLGVDIPASTRTASGLYYRDIVVGTGGQARVGSDVSVRYSGAFVNGTVFDSGGPSRTPVNFRIGRGDVVGGFDEGTVGMRVGGKRQVIIPPYLGYGSRTYQSIPGNSILVFTLELLSTT